MLALSTVLDVLLIMLGVLRTVRCAPYSVRCAPYNVSVGFVPYSVNVICAPYSVRCASYKLLLFSVMNQLGQVRSVLHWLIFCVLDRVFAKVQYPFNKRSVS